jgi:hypothetical protein
MKKLEKNYYVYIYLNLLNPGMFKYQDLEFEYEPIYIGKGIDSRSHNHLTACLNINDKKGYKRLFYQKLRKIIKSGSTPKIIIYKNDLSEKEAFDLEISLISKIKRRITKEGPLCNNSKGGEGASGTISPRYSICVYNNEGKILSVETSAKNCSIKYKVPLIAIYRHVNGTRKLPSNNCRFRKKSDNIKKLCNNEEIVINKKGKHSKISTLSKIVYQYDKEGNFIKSYPNSNIASLELGINRSAIQNNLTNRSKTCNNYIFKNK